MSKSGIDDVVCRHFRKVFDQNPIPDGYVWKEYWKVVDEVFWQLDHVTSKEASQNIISGPSIQEINKLMKCIDPKSSVLGSMSGDLVKFGGNYLLQAVHNCLIACFMQEDIPLQMKIERIKNSGPIYELDNYRGIFLRYLILSLLQKWLYEKCAPTVDAEGTELAFGGRKARSVREVLLIVKLLQDHARWTKRPLVLKFLDIRKFFDTMNYKSALIEAYKSGISGKYWRLYRNLNAEKTCTPCTPLGECGEISVDEVFVQGSSDAMLMAWNMVDSYNKGDMDMIDPVCCTEGVEIPRLGFVDDLLEFSRSIFETQVSCVSDEVFQNQHRITWKPVKCKILPMNIKIEEGEITLNNEKLEIVKEHKYLGTIVSDKGRVSDLGKRINESKGVLNELVEICKCEAVGPFRFPYMMTLINTCFMKKFEHGCEVWDSMLVKDREQVNRLIPQAIKRVLELPRSTPTDAIRHDFGLIELENEVEMEKIILTARTMETDEIRI